MNTIMTDYDIAKQVMTAFIAGIAPKTDKGIEWDIEGHKVYVEVVDPENERVKVAWPIDEVGYWFIDLEYGKVLDMKWVSNEE